MQLSGTPKGFRAIELVGLCSSEEGGRQTPRSVPMFSLRRKILVVFFLLVYGLGGAWMLDISVSAINMGTFTTYNSAFLTNGVWSISPAQGYHVGMFMMLGSLFGLSLLYIRMAVDGR